MTVNCVLLQMLLHIIIIDYTTSQMGGIDINQYMASMNPDHAQYWSSTAKDITFPHDDEFETTLPPPSTETPRFYCNNPCPRAYVKYGQICAKTIIHHYPNMDNTKHIFFPFIYYQTFKDFCDMMDHNCGKRKWIIAYKGACQKPFPTWPEKPKAIFDRKNEIMREALKINLKENTTIPPHYLESVEYT